MFIIFLYNFLYRSSKTGKLADLYNDNINKNIAQMDQILYYLISKLATIGNNKFCKLKKKRSKTKENINNNNINYKKTIEWRKYI